MLVSFCKIKIPVSRSSERYGLSHNHLLVASSSLCISTFNSFGTQKSHINRRHQKFRLHDAILYVVHCRRPMMALGVIRVPLFVLNDSPYTACIPAIISCFSMIGLLVTLFLVELLKAVCSSNNLVEMTYTWWLMCHCQGHSIVIEEKWTYWVKDRINTSGYLNDFCFVANVTDIGTSLILSFETSGYSTLVKNELSHLQ